MVIYKSVEVVIECETYEIDRKGISVNLKYDILWIFSQ